MVTTAELIERLRLYPPGWEVTLRSEGYDGDDVILIVTNEQSNKAAGKPEYDMADVLEVCQSQGTAELTSLLRRPT